MGTRSDGRARLLQLIKLDKPMVIDADALNLLALQKKWPAKFCERAVLTPHPGEMKRLSRHLRQGDPPIPVVLSSQFPRNDDERIEVALQAARNFKQVIVLKGHHTVVTDGDLIYVNRTGDSSLSKAGTGDVLSGILGTLLAQEMSSFDASCAAVWIHGRAGELAGRSMGRRSVLARDVIDHIPASILEYEQAR
jgi:NAD(P)H-hydrate epimerase